MLNTFWLKAVSLSLAVVAASIATVNGADDAKTALDYKVKDIQGEEVDLATYKGKVVMIVNTASKCGYTPQYAGLEELYKKYKDKGFVVLAFPANEFGKQEPGENKQIAEFCKTQYSVDFPLFAKSVVKGEGISDLYTYLTSKDSNPQYGGPIKWNFTKFLIDREGKVVRRFEPGVDPDSDETKKAIEEQLAKKS